MELIDNKTYSVEEYLKILEESPVKLEYGNGQIFSKVGGSFNHSLIANNINLTISFALNAQNSTCFGLNSDIQVFIETADSIVFPDGAFMCSDPDFSETKINAITNPVLVIEVLSKSTSDYDRGAKFRKYCSLPSFQEYVLIDQYQPIVDTLFRADNKSWNMVTTIGLDKTIHLRSLDVTIRMEDIYKNTVNLQDPPFLLDF